MIIFLTCLNDISRKQYCKTTNLEHWYMIVYMYKNIHVSLFKIKAIIAIKLKMSIRQYNNFTCCRH